MAVTEIQFGKSRYQEIDTMVKWCHEHFGDGGWLARCGCSWAVESAFGNTFFKFENESDATLFALRWK
jgi:hypothetical protein